MGAGGTDSNAPVLVRACARRGCPCGAGEGVHTTNAYTRWECWGRGSRGTCGGGWGKEEVGYGGHMDEELALPDREAGEQR